VKRTVSVLLAVLLLCASWVADSPASVAKASSSAVTVQVSSISPSTPTPSKTKQPLVITLQLTNTTARNLGTVEVSAERATPITSQQGLERALAHPAEPDSSLSSPIDPDPDRPVTARLPAHASTSVTFRTSTDIPQDAGLCLCANAIYPLYFSVAAGGAVLGHTQTYLPAFDVKPTPAQVSWIWPLVERPHRLTSDTTFTDDQLAASVSGGRLDRMLQVVEDAGTDVPMALVVDPELIDELAVMANGYQVQQDGQKVAAGTGTLAAQQWLARLRAVLDYPGVELYATAPGDPDVQGLTQADLGWSSQLDKTARARVIAALGGHTPVRTLAWPADGTLRTSTLDALAAKGAQSVIVRDSSLAAQKSAATGPTTALRTLTSPSGGITAIVTSHYIQRYVAPVLSRGGAGLAQLPQLVAEVAIHAVDHPNQPKTGGYLAIAAPRDLDPDPEVAARALRDTAATFWSTALPPGAAQAKLHSAGSSHLVAGKTAQQLPSAVISAARQVAAALPTLDELFAPNSGAGSVLAPLPVAVQRLESLSWRGDPVGASTLATMITATIESMSDGVHLVNPSRGTYTLASSNSPLPVTVANDLGYAVEVQVRVRTVNGLAGFTADPETAEVAPHSRVTVRVNTHVERTGRLRVAVELMTSGNVQLGEPVYLSVRSTALGTIGVVITIVAGAVLALALLVRLWRRLRHRRQGPATADVPPVAAAASEASS
jgi:hypothetical protein